MKTTKTILAVALLIVGFAYAVGAGHPTLGTVDQCCGPQPEDFRWFRWEFTTDGVFSLPITGNGFVLTHLLTDDTPFVGEPLLLQVDENEETRFIRNVTAFADVNLGIGIPFAAGSTMNIRSLALPFGGTRLLLIGGYVY